MLLADVIHPFSHILTIGTVGYIIDLLFFLIISIGILAGVILFPGTFWLSLLTIIADLANYGSPPAVAGPWLTVTIKILFWIRDAGTYLVACFQSWYFLTAKTLIIQNITPAWILPVFLVMLSGTLAGLTRAINRQSMQCG